MAQVSCQYGYVYAVPYAWMINLLNVKQETVLCSPFIIIILTALCGLRDISALTRDQTWTHISQSAESEPLDCQATSLFSTLKVIFISDDFFGHWKRFLGNFLGKSRSKFGAHLQQAGRHIYYSIFIRTEKCPFY